MFYICHSFDSSLREGSRRDAVYMCLMHLSFASEVLRTVVIVVSKLRRRHTAIIRREIRHSGVRLGIQNMNPVLAETFATWNFIQQPFA